MTSFVKALQDAAVPMIAEIKPYSPELGDLLKGRDPKEIAESYQQGGVACLSVTTGRWHGGNIAMLEAIAGIAEIPVLRKDFITSRHELRRSLGAGADSVLLSAQLIRRQELMMLIDEALRMGLTPFVETNQASDLEGLSFPLGTVLAICNRDIREKECDDGTVSQSLALYQAGRQSNPELLISASAIRTPYDARVLMAAGYDGILIGTGLLMQDTDIQEVLSDYSSAIGLSRESLKKSPVCSGGARTNRSLP
ncbi:hypothetical protein [Motiliproteus sp. MSK22-1]|uniref:hypothetical protein n=1 Tax=Motiliproteus sp. MSK22-1 TaxID=1897630 RepID=UPI000975569D|nr:hypothetical protein [Motiliproteus sp. MSK22-1]OMH29137.1 hypothetical protein BGP75_20520 [Motiliproteus sp. MSK22-1]